MEEHILNLKKLREKIKLGGGEKKIKKQHKRGKLTARERINTLLDKNSFQEIGMFVEHHAQELGMKGKEIPSEGVITGSGTINGRQIYIFAQDFTVMGGSLGEMHASKIVKIMEMSQKSGAPLIGINDSGGARIQEGVNALAGYGEIFKRNTLNSGLIPQISIILGPCAGGAVYSPAITDFIFMVNNISKMFITGPKVIKSVTGEEVTFEELGGAIAHNQLSGVASFLAEDEEQCFSQVRKLLSYIPNNNLEGPPVKEYNDPFDRVEMELRDIIPSKHNKPYDVKEIIGLIIDKDSFMEVQKYYAQNIVVGFGRFAGKSIGIIANQPKIKAGCLDIDSSDKATRFIRFCDAFNIPLLTLTDVPGYLPGIEQEHGGIIRHGAKLLYAFSEANVPKITVILRKAYGGAYIGMNSKHLGADYVFAWPNAEIAVMGPRGAVNIIFRKEINNAVDSDKERQDKIKDYREKFANPYCAASHGYIDNVICPEKTRSYIINALDSIISKREERISKKHGNIPM